MLGIDYKFDLYPITMPYKNILNATLLTLVSVNHQIVMAADTPLFTKHTISVDFEVSQPVVAADILPQKGYELLILGVNKQQQRVLGIYGFDPQTTQFEELDTLVLSNNVFAFDLGDAGANGIQSLYFLSRNKIEKYLPAQALVAPSLIEEQIVSSMYLVNRADSITRRDFARDINNDGKDDFLLADFEQLNLWLTDCCGKRHQQSLPIAANLEVDQDSLTYKETELYFADMDLDNKTDILFAEAGKLNVYSQNSGKGYAQQPLQIKINSNIYGINWWDIIGADGQKLDQSQLTHRKVEDIKDFNGDGIADIAVRYTQSSGVLDRTNDYEFFYGQIADGKLSYAQSPSTSITSDDTLSDLTLLDLTEDGKQEVMVSSFDLGLSQIVGALLSGSIDLDVLIFSMDETENFPSKPLINQEVEMTFSLTSGRSGEPLMKVADVNGDKVKDLIFSDGDEKINLLLATPGARRPYAKRTLSQKVQVPQNAKYTALEDINRDGKADLVFHYGRLDDAALLSQITVLMAN